MQLPNASFETWNGGNHSSASPIKVSETFELTLTNTTESILRGYDGRMAFRIAAQFPEKYSALLAWRYRHSVLPVEVQDEYAVVILIETNAIYLSEFLNSQWGLPFDKHCLRSHVNDRRTQHNCYLKIDGSNSQNHPRSLQISTFAVVLEAFSFERFNYISWT